MRFETSQSMRLGQQMKLAPRVIQSMEILQMPLAELQERIDQELENNITLELAEPERDPEPDRAASSDREQESADDFERLEEFSQDNPEAVDNAFEGSVSDDRAGEAEYTPDYERRTRIDSGEPDGKMAAMANAPAPSASLHEQLHEQWGLADVEPRTRELGDLLIDKLEEDGYLRMALDEVIDQAPQPLRPIAREELERTLIAVQLLLEPAGIAARDASECLLLQLDALEASDEWLEADNPPEITRLARHLVERHLDDLMNNRLPRIAEREGATIDEVKQALQILRKLSLAPARRLVSERVEPIVPDAIVEFDEDQNRYIAYLNDASLPQLRINREYALMSKDRAMEKRDREFIKTNLANAQWLIDAVDQRRSTILRVINVVLEEQRDFFDYGPQALKPVAMTDVAERLGIHVATVSRAVADKHLSTPRGIVPLRRFFSGGLQTESGEDMSYDAVKSALQEVVDTEDKGDPFSDEALVKELKSRGIEIARRTVAKYRGQLGIPSARLRKTF